MPAGIRDTIPIPRIRGGVAPFSPKEYLQFQEALPGLTMLADSTETQ